MFGRRYLRGKSGTTGKAAIISYRAAVQLRASGKLVEQEPHNGQGGNRLRRTIGLAERR